MYKEGIASSESSAVLKGLLNNTATQADETDRRDRRDRRRY